MEGSSVEGLGVVGVRDVRGDGSRGCNRGGVREVVGWGVQGWWVIVKGWGSMGWCG